MDSTDEMANVKDTIVTSVSFSIDTDNIKSEINVSAECDTSATDEKNVSESIVPKELEQDAAVLVSSKKTKKKFRHSKKGYIPSKDNTDRNVIRRVHHTGTKFKQGRKRAQSFPSLSKFFLPHKRPRKEVMIPPTKFLLGGNISDPLNLNSLQDEDINRAMNAVTPQSSPLPTPPRHKAKIDVIIPPNIRDPLNLLEPLDNEEYEKRLEMQQRKPRKRTKIRRRTTEAIMGPPEDKGTVKEESSGETTTMDAASHVRKRSGSESDNTQKGKDSKKLRRLDSLDKIVSPVVPQPGAWMRARAPPRPAPPERPTSPHRIKQKTEPGAEYKLPKFNPKNSRYQFGNYDRYYGYRNLNSMMDVRLQVFEMHRHLFQNKDVLDIGCNVGHVTIAVARTLGARSVDGIDIDPLLIDRAKNNLRSFIPVPSESLKVEEDKKPVDCQKYTEEKCGNCSGQEQKQEKICEDEKKPQQGKKIRRPRKNRKAGKQEQQYYFPMSLSLMFGPLGFPVVKEPSPIFPYNVTFKTVNYVPREEVSVGVGSEGAQYDLILCLSATKWMHLNWGDAGLKRAFRRMFADLRPGGKLVLEAQNWASYRLKKRLTPTVYENFNSIELFPHKFREYLLSPEVGFSKCCILGVPQHASKGFRRPIQLYVKGDFTPSKARWSDAYAPSSHHRSEAEPPRRTVYAPVEPAYRPSDDAPSCGAATPYSPNLDCSADDSPFYNPRSDSYAPSYEPPRPTVYATLPSPLAAGAGAGAGAGASPVPSPAASPAAAVSPVAAPDPLGARGIPACPAYSPHAQDD